MGRQRDKFNSMQYNISPRRMHDLETIRYLDNHRPQLHPAVGHTSGTNPCDNSTTLQRMEHLMHRPTHFQVNHIFWIDPENRFLPVVARRSTLGDGLVFIFPQATVLTFTSAVGKSNIRVLWQHHTLLHVISQRY